MKHSRVLRIESEIQRTLAELIARHVKDPRVGSVTVTAVQAAEDLSEARVFFLPFGGAHPPAEVLAGLTRAAGFLRGEAARALRLRHAPRLTFVLDEQFDRAARLTALIDQAVRGPGTGAGPAGESVAGDAAASAADPSGPAGR